MTAAKKAAKRRAAARAARPPPPPRNVVSFAVVAVFGPLAAVLAAGALFLLGRTLFALAAAAASSAFVASTAAVLSWLLRQPGRVFRGLVWRPKWWVAALEVIFMGSFYSRSVVATVLLTHPLGWALAPGALGFAGSLVTFLLAALTVAWGDAKASAAECDVARRRGADADAMADAKAEVEERMRDAAGAVTAVTPIAWGLACAAISTLSRASFSVAAVAFVAWGWWRVVSKSMESSDDDEQRQREEREQREQEQEQQRHPPPPGFASWDEWMRYHHKQQQQQRGGARGGQQRQRQQPQRRTTTTNHLSQRPPPGATGDVETVLSSLNYLEVLGLSEGGRTITWKILAGLGDAAVKAEWRRLALSVHPDKHLGVGADEAFILVTKAYANLQDAGARAIYAREELGLG